MGEASVTDLRDTETQAAQDKLTPRLPAPDIAGALPTPFGAESARDCQQPVPPALVEPLGDATARDRFAQRAHEYVREYIRIADQKAAFVFTAATALLAFQYKTGVSARWLRPVMQWNVLDVAAFVAMTGLAVGALLALWVVVPRTHGSRRGFLFWEAIAEYHNAREYADELRLLSGASLSLITSEHCFDLARVCRKKYSVLGAAIWAAAVGLASSLVVFLFGQ